MTRYCIALFSIGTLFCVTQAYAASLPVCPPADGVAIQVLGSGGPIADDGRASSSYLIWVDGKSRVLIDAGGGSFLRFGEARGSFLDLDFIGLSHFHADHSADFPALLKSGNFSGRKRPLTVAGPSGNGRFPALQAYLASMIGANDGAYAYLSGYLDGSGGLAPLLQQEISADSSLTQDLLGSSDDIAITAMRVPHGIVPAVAFRVDVRGTSFVFASDQNGSDDDFAKFAQDASVLVMHMPIAEDTTDGALQLHAIPSKIAAIASIAGADQLLLSHFMARSLKNLDDNVQIVRDGFTGGLVVAEDLLCQL